MSSPSMTHTAILLAVLGAACASAPTPAPSKSPEMTPLNVKGVAPDVTPIKVDTKLLVMSDRVALIWGYPACSSRPWVVSVVDLGTRVITFRGLATTSELPAYFPSPTGEACYKGPCPTMAVEMGIPPSLTGPALASGSGTMMGGIGKGRYATGTLCSDPPMLDDGDLIDLSMRLVQGRNDAAAAVAARPAR